MCAKKKALAGYLLGAVDTSFFHAPESVEVYNALRRIMVESGESPNYRILLEDPSLSKEARSFLKDSEATITTSEEAKRAVSLLSKYRKTRALNEIMLGISAAFDSSKFDLEALLDECSSKLASARSSRSIKNAFLTFGTNSNAKEFVKDLIYGDHSEEIVPSGIEPFDRESGGLLRGGLTVIGASSGGGKSLLANHMSAVIPTKGFKVLLVPLEMTKQEMTARVIANRARVDVTSILTGKLSEEDKDKAYAKYRKWEKLIKKAGGQLSIYKPDGDMTFEEVLAATNTYDADVRIFDYISLFKGVSGDDSWQQLGAIARSAKIHAGSTNSCNVLLCQVNEDGKVRYARAISEHANNSFIWVAKKEEREKEIGRIQIEQPKARNSKSFPFDVGFEWAYMRVVDADKVSSDVGDVATPMKNYADV